MKTFDEILQQHYIHDKGLNNPEYIKNSAFEFALQVAEAVRDECSRIASAQNTITDIVLEIDKEIDLTQFIK
jgi:hypothetical protein